MNKYNGIDIDTLNETNMFARNMNVIADNIITTYQTSNERLYFFIWSKITINEFIFDDKRKLLTIPVLYNTSTSNAHNYLIRIILSIGEYNTEIDALTQQTTQKYTQHVGLIREN